MKLDIINNNKPYKFCNGFYDGTIDHFLEINKEFIDNGMISHYPDKINIYLQYNNNLSKLAQVIENKYVKYLNVNDDVIYTEYVESNKNRVENIYTFQFLNYNCILEFNKMNNGIIGNNNPNGFGYNIFIPHFLNKNDKNEFNIFYKKLQKFNNRIKKFIQMEENKLIELDKLKYLSNNYISIINFSGDKLILNDFELKENEIDIKIPFELSYNDNIINNYPSFLNKISNATKGVIILSGEPGTGKTTLIRKLIKEKDLKNKKMLYVTVDDIKAFASMQMKDFILNLKSILRNYNYNSLLFIVEDAEEIISKRDGFKNSIVDLINNTSDGIFNDLIPIQFLFTHNCNFSTIDPAILRKGRLLAQMEFNKLTKDKSNKLLEYLELECVDEELTLAEVMDKLNETPDLYQNKSFGKTGFKINKQLQHQFD